MMTTSKRAYKDSFARRTRTEPMQLPAELLQAFLPPSRMIGNGHVVSTAVLEPAYELGGDAFDHCLTDTTLHATVIDAKGRAERSPAQPRPRRSARWACPWRR
ncbi:hypothetical protein [Streptomyces bobili]|uniref:hypothetical protein n=1 Tax=Streptomyces bobili TaxID=67280 RepID=UPI003134359A